MGKTTCVLFWLMFSIQPAFSGEIPEVLHIQNAGRPYPAWVAADRVLTPSGEIDPVLFSPSERSIINRYLQHPQREGCIQLGAEEIEETTIGSREPSRQNLASMARTADWLFSAIVKARAPGFSSSTPGTLLEIAPEETFKGPRNRGGLHYIFMPVGTFTLDGTKICKTDERYAALPEVGDRVFLFIDLFWRNKGPFLWAGGDSGIVTIKEGSLSLPKRYRNTEPSLATGGEGDLVDFIQKSLGRENR